jgi:hypothetical protein
MVTYVNSSIISPEIPAVWLRGEANRLGASIRKCGIDKYRYTLLKNAEWYSLNVRPNQNESAACFWYELIARMLLRGEALVFQVGTERFLADDGFTIDAGNGVQKLRFENVGRLDYRMHTPLFPEDVLYFRYNNHRAQSAVRSLCAMYSSMMQVVAEDYQKSGGSKGRTVHRYPSDGDGAGKCSRLEAAQPAVSDVFTGTDLESAFWANSPAATFS